MLSDMFNSLCYRASRGFIIQENTYNMIFEGQNSISVRLPTTILSHAITCIHALRWHAITALCSDIVALSSRAITTLWCRGRQALPAHVMLSQKYSLCCALV